MSDRKEENEEKNESGVGWMVAAGVAIGAAASAIGYIVGKNSSQGPQCSESSSTRQQPSQSQKYRSQVSTCEKCAICLDDMDVAVLPCRHTYHGKCVNQWLTENGTCPTCRIPVRKMQ